MTSTTKSGSADPHTKIAAEKMVSCRARNRRRRLEERKVGEKEELQEKDEKMAWKAGFEGR